MVDADHISRRPNLPPATQSEQLETRDFDLTFPHPLDQKQHMVDQDEDETEATAGVNHVNSSGQGVAKAQCQLLPRCKQKKAARVQAGRTETLPRLVDHGHRLLLFAESSDQSPAKRQLSPPPSGGPNQGPVGERPPTSSVMHPHSPGLLQSAPLHYCH